MNQFSFGMIGLYEKALPCSFSMCKKLEAAQRAGYEFLEMSTDQSDAKIDRVFWNVEQKRELKRVLVDTIPILTMCLSANRSFPLGSADAGVLRRGYEIACRAVEFACEFGIRVVQIAGYDAFPEPATADSRKRYVETLERLSEHSAGCGVVIAMENVEPPYHSSIASMSECVDEVGSPYLMVYPDIGNLCAAQIDLQADLPFHVGKTAAFHLKDTKVNVYRNVAYGEGIVDFTSFFQYLHDQCFHGLLTAEMWATQDELASVAYIEEALTFLREKYALIRKVKAV